MALRMSRPSRILAVALAMAWGCASENFDLLSSGASKGSGGAGGSSAAGGSGAAAGTQTSGTSSGGHPPAAAGGAAGRGGAVAAGGTGNVGALTGEGGDDQGGAGPIACVASADCPMGTPICFRDRTTNLSRCIACLSDFDCSPGKACNTYQGLYECTPSCRTSDQCPFDRPFCDQFFFFCVECTVDLHCAPDRCLQPGGTCVDCRDSFDCPLDKPICAQYECRACTGMFQCGPYRYCDLNTGRCEGLPPP